MSRKLGFNATWSMAVGGMAINSTIFATARLSHSVAQAGELPAWLDHLNGNHVPDRSVVVLGGAAGLVAAIGSLSTLVEAASLAFLGTFGVVAWLAFRERAGRRVLTGIGCTGAGAAAVALVVRLATTDPLALIFLGLLVAAAVVARPLILGRVTTE